MKIKCFEFNQNGEKFYVGKIKAGDLVKRYKISFYDPKTDKGYQRSLIETRAKAFGRFISRMNNLIKGTSPISALVNIRSKDLKYDQENFELEVPDNQSFWVVDAQHRIKGIEWALENENVNLEDYEIPLVITNYPEEYKEAYQFLVINRTQKGVRADLAERIIAKTIQKEGEKAIYKLSANGALGPNFKDIMWSPRAIKIADQLNSDQDSSWYNKIKLPNQKSKTTVVSQKSFTDSLKPILTDDRLEGVSEVTLANMLKNYWKAIEDLCPKSFKDSKEYLIQRTTGVFVLNSVFIVVLDKAFKKWKTIEPNKDQMKEILKLADSYMEDSYWAEVKNFGTSQKIFKMIATEIKRDIASNFED